jgi:hypothetical protein
LTSSRDRTLAHPVSSLWPILQRCYNNYVTGGLPLMKPTHLRAYAFTPSICSTRQSDTSANIHKREHKFGFALMFFDISGACLCSCVCFYSSLLLLLELCYHSLYRLQETLNREDPCRETKGYKRTLWPQF